ncbi:MAG TPA: hypothetical protein VGP98_02165, partial [Pyrinomonadaceae bacterium]|nr:hypothetical protein [Pyrinomonadaceae bacterium]
MLRQKSTLTLVSYLSLLIFLLVSATAALAQTPADSTTVASATTVTPDETTAAKTSVESPSVAESPKTTTKVTPVAGPPPMQAQCKRNLKADVVAIAQPIFLNRLGAVIPGGMVFALKSDTVGGLGVQLRADKRPRPIVLRANVGDCIQITLTNNIPPSNFAIVKPTPAPPGMPYNTPEVSLHVQGMEWVTGPKDDGSFVGKNDSSLATPSPSPAPSPGTTWPSQTQTYTLYAKAEGTYLMYSMGDTSSVGSQIMSGLFGALNVQPAGAEWYRSQVTQQDLKLASSGSTPDGHPIIKYDAVYPAGSTYPDGTPIPPNTPILKMLDSNNNIVHTDLTALITGPNAGRFTQPQVNCDANAPVPPAGVDPLFCKNPASPDRVQPYREITVIYHGALGSSLDGSSPGVASQAFPVLQANSTVRTTTVAGQDAFAINYGTGGIGAEIYANRVGVGPMGSCADCKFEEFFLSSWSVGDPAMVVDRPANATVLNQAPAPAPVIIPPGQLCSTT